ncbi:DENN domain [Macleaya cordata]|uniref:DENN domain n=1 Tax=Macleaya cordata TaxID=56857 RepID=A0A200PVQ3_MACCD|nr:DENN domain [Macleaya cordata]
METKEDVEVNDDRPPSPCKDVEVNDDRPPSPCKDVETNDDRPQSPCEVVEANDDQHLSPCKDVEVNDDRPLSPCKDAEANGDQPLSPCKDVEANDDRPLLPCNDVEANDDQPLPPCKDAEVNDDRQQSPCKDVEANEDQLPPCNNAEANDDRPLSPLKDVEANDDQPLSPCKDAEANDDRPLSPCKDVEGNNDQPPSPCKDVEANDDRPPPSPCKVLHQISEEKVSVPSAKEAITTVYMGSPNMPPVAPPGHRRAKSEAVPPGHRRSNSFQKLKTQIQKAWHWGGSPDESHGPWFFNPEVLANQKRQWYQLHSKTSDLSKYKEPTSLFEHFVVVGLHSGSNLEAVEESFAKRRTWELEMQKSERMDLNMLQYHGPSIPTLEPEILFKYPPGKRLAMRPKDLPAFCFPGGVKARLMERTPSLSDLNKVVYGQEHLGRDDMSFIFTFKVVADNATIYGVCLHVQEIVQRPPVGVLSPLSQSSGRFCRFLVSAPRCYCLLTRVPFFELHYEMLNSIITQERLNRITEFVSEVTLTDHVPSGVNSQYQISENIDSPDRGCSTDWKASAIPLDSAVALTAAAAGIISDDEVPSFSVRVCETQTSESVSATEASDFCRAREIDDSASETSETRCDGFERMNGSYGNGQTSPEVGSFFFSKSRTLERVGSSESLFSSVRSTGSEDEDEEVDSENDKNSGDDVIMNWAREHKNDLLQIICGYHSLPLPPRGSETVFQPLEHLQAIKYRRPAVFDLGLCEDFPDIKLQRSLAAEVNVRLAAAEEALALSIWTTATVCRVLSLESVLAVFAAVLLEKQVVVVCPNLGVLSAVVLSLIPMIRPFEWQSLLLPVLPRSMLDFLDAPVPFIVGIQQKPANLKMKTSDLINVNVYKDQQVKMCYLPPLPRHRELVSELGPIHARLSCQNSIAARHPVYKCNEMQAEAAGEFLNVMRRYLESLCADFRSHTITSVQSNNDRVSLLLKESFIDSFPSRDRPFIKLFVDTQLFTVLSDSRLACYEHE